MKCYSTRQLVREISCLQRDVDVISFDVFDTLLMREVAPPEQMKIPAAKWLLKRAAEVGRKFSMAEVLQARDAVETLLRKKSEEEGGDHECHLDRLAVTWAERMLGPTSCNEIAEALARVEIAGELAVCRAVPGMHEVVEHARSLEMKVILLSDTHLGREHVRQLLNNSGLCDFYDELYVSSELGVSKRTGRMFLHIAKVQQLSLNRWLHIGGTLRSNAGILQQLGLRLKLFDDSESGKRAAEARKLRNLGEIHASWYGAQCARWCRPPAEARVCDVPYMVGFSVLGPLLTAFLHMVLERVREHGVPLVLFPARDGFVLRRIFKLIKPVVLPDAVVRDEYVFLNRKTTYLASMDHIGFRELPRGLGTLVPTLQTMLSRFSLDPMGFRDIAERCGLTLDEELQKMHDPRLLEFIRHPEVLKRLRQEQRVKRDQLRRYLEQFGFWDCDRVALVDLGWNGTTQDALTWAFLEEPRWPRLFGWYLGFRPGQAPITTPSSTYEGLVYERGRHGQHRSAIFRYVELFELATRAPHATTVDLRENLETGEICPVFKPEHSATRLAELHDRNLVTSMQAGIVDFTEAYAKTVIFQDHGVEAFCDYACEVTDLLLRYPSVEVSRALTGFFHSEDFGSDVAVQDARLSLRLPWWDWFRQRRSRSQVLWMEGTLARANGPVLLGFYNLFRVFMKRHY